MIIFYNYKLTNNKILKIKNNYGAAKNADIRVFLVIFEHY